MTKSEIKNSRIGILYFSKMPHQNQKGEFLRREKHFEKSLSGFFSICANNFGRISIVTPFRNRKMPTKLRASRHFPKFFFICRTKKLRYIFFMSKNICFKCIKIFFGIPIFPSFRKKVSATKRFLYSPSVKIVFKFIHFFSRKFFGNFRIFQVLIHQF